MESPVDKVYKISHILKGEIRLTAPNKNVLLIYSCEVQLEE